ncbi:MAG: SDR family NAD(P)-dependent oxidoreductase [Arenicellales bacterium]
MLQGKVSLVIGASRGIGAGVARELAAHGSHVIAAARTLEESQAFGVGPNAHELPGSLNQTVADIVKSGGSAEADRLDVLDSTQVAQLVDKVSRKHGAIDIVANCAMGFPDTYKGSVLTSDESQWGAMVDVGVRGKYSVIHHASKVMVQKRSGLIVNISAGASKIDYYQPLFRVAMAAVDRLTEAAAQDLKEFDITCLSIWPRWVRTEWMLMAAKDSTLGVEVTKQDLESSDSPEFVGRAIAHIAADPDMRALSGQIIPVLALAHLYGFDDVDGSRPQLDDFTKIWCEKLASIRAITND